MKIIALLAVLFALSASAADVDAILGQQGKVSGDVHRYGVHVQPALAPGSWAAFGNETVMGDLVLKTNELDGVVRELERGSFEITAVHNHLAGESPALIYLHYSGRGRTGTIAEGIRDALARVNTKP